MSLFRVAPAWLIAAIGAWLVIAVTSAVWTQVIFTARLASDYEIYLEAGRRALENANPYGDFTVGLSFAYPPPALLLFGPLALIPTEIATALWQTSTVAATVAAVFLIWRASGGGRPLRFAILAAGLLFLWNPWLETATIGQVNALVMLGWALFVTGLKEDRWRWAGDAGLALAVILKITPILLLAIPLLTWDWRRLLRVGGILALLTVASLAAFGTTPWPAFLGIIPELFAGYPGLDNQAIPPTVNYLVFGVAEYGTALSIPAIWSGRAFSALALGGWLILTWRRRKRDDATSLAVLGIACVGVASSLIWYHHLVFLALPVFFFLLRGRLAARAVATVAVAFGLIQLDRMAEVLLLWPPVLSISGYAAIVGVLLWSEARSANAAGGSTPSNRCG